MNTFDIGRPDEDFPIGFRQRQFFQQLAGDLDRNPRLWLAVLAPLIEIRPQSGFDQVENAAQRAVMIEAGNIIELLAQGLRDIPDRFRPDFLVIGEIGVEFDPRQFQQSARNTGIGSKRLFLDCL